MPPRKKAAAETATEGGDEGGKVVEIKRRSPFDWEGLKKEIARDHWRKLRVVIQIRDKIHAGKPAQLDAAKAMLKARGLEEVVEAKEATQTQEERAAEVVDEGLCEFHRRDSDGKPGCWWPTNHFKAAVKENWSVLGFRVEHRGSRGAIAEGLFVVSTTPGDLDYVYLGDKPDGVDTSVSHHMGPRGPQSSIKRNEYFSRPTMSFEIWIATALVDKLPDRSFAAMLFHAQEHGIGANRSQGIGKFDVVSVTELSAEAEPPAAVTSSSSTDAA